METSTAATCLVCGAELSENVIECSKCGTPHHLACWEYTNRCAVFGCGCEVGRTRSREREAPDEPLVMRTASSAPAVRHPSDDRPREPLPKFDASAPAASPPRSGRGVVLTVAALVVIGAGGAVFFLGASRDPEYARPSPPLPNVVPLKTDPLAESLERTLLGAKALQRQQSDARAAARAAAESSIPMQLKSFYPEIRRCYERALNTAKPGLAGKYTVEFDIDEQGAVSKVLIREDSVGDAKMAACVRAKIWTWRFNVRAGATRQTIRYPIIFRPAL